MKLFRFGDSGKEQPGVELPQGKRISVAAFGEDFNEHFFAHDGLSRLRDWLSVHASKQPEATAQVRIAAPIARPPAIICVGLNYRKHAEESGAPIPREPILFMKHPGSYSGPNDPIVIPRGSEKTDWEVELAIVIGRGGHNITEQLWRDHVAGFSVMNDVSERTWQLERGGQWDKGKGFPTFSPIGPCLVTTDEIKNPGNLRLWLEVNGRCFQNGNTSDMIFTVGQIVSYASQCFHLLPGDVITTGTPSGVGLGQKPPRYLQAGDVLRLGIDGIGVLEQKCISAG